MVVTSWFWGAPGDPAGPFDHPDPGPANLGDELTIS
jgi:hypothetical protein